MKRTSLHTPEYATVVALLRDLRLEAGLSQSEAAAELERPQTWLSALEVGGRGLDLVQIRELAAVYGVDFPSFAARLEQRLKDPPYRPPRRRRVDAGIPVVPEAPATRPGKVSGKPKRNTGRKPSK